MLTVKRILDDPGLKMPSVAHLGEDAGYDLFSGEREPVHIYPGEQKLIRTGWAVEHDPFVVYRRYDQTVFPVSLIAKQSSGQALKRMLDVKAGVIDSGYRNELKALLYNYGSDVQVVLFGDKIAQLVPIITLTDLITEVKELSDSARGLAGWGSGHTDGKV
jgi:dUTP pyrophosphatase